MIFWALNSKINVAPNPFMDLIKSQCLVEWWKFHNKWTHPILDYSFYNTSKSFIRLVFIKHIGKTHITSTLPTFFSKIMIFRMTFYSHNFREYSVKILFLNIYIIFYFFEFRKMSLFLFLIKKKIFWNNF